MVEPTHLKNIRQVDRETPNWGNNINTIWKKPPRGSLYQHLPKGAVLNPRGWFLCAPLIIHSASRKEDSGIFFYHFLSMKFVCQLADFWWKQQLVLNLQLCCMQSYELHPCLFNQFILYTEVNIWNYLENDACCDAAFSKFTNLTKEQKIFVGPQWLGCLAVSGYPSKN